MDTQRDAVAVAANESFAVTAQHAAHPLLRRLLVLATFGLGFWLLTCMLHSAPASADTGHTPSVSHSHRLPDPLGGLRAAAPHVPALTEVGTHPVKAIEHLDTRLRRDLHRSVQRMTQDTARVVTGSVNAVRAMTRQATSRLSAARHTLHTVTSNSASRVTKRVEAQTHRPAVRTSHRAGRVVAHPVPARHAAPSEVSQSIPAHHREATVAAHVDRIPGAAPTAPRPNAPQPNAPAAPGAGGATPTTGSVGTQLAAALTPVAHAEPGEHRSRKSRKHSRLHGIAGGKPTFSPD